MKRYVRALSTPAILLGVAFHGQVAIASAAAAEFAKPALVTSIGQSSDVVVVKALLNTQLKMGLAVNPLAKVPDLAGFRTLVLVVGASAKGLGAAGLDMAKETARTQALVAAAREQKIALLVLHTGGESRRGKTSNDLINLVVPAADAVVVVAAGNKDRLFHTLAEPRKVAVTEVGRLAEAGAAVKALFKE